MARSSTGPIVPGALNRAIWPFEVVVKNEVVVAADFALFVQHKQAGIKVEVSAVGAASVPPQTYHDRGQSRRLLAQGDVATLAQRNRHLAPPRGRVMATIAPGCLGLNAFLPSFCCPADEAEGRVRWRR